MFFPETYLLFFGSLNQIRFLCNKYKNTVFCKEALKTLRVVKIWKIFCESPAATATSTDCNRNYYDNNLVDLLVHLLSQAFQSLRDRCRGSPHFFYPFKHFLSTWDKIIKSMRVRNFSRRNSLVHQDNVRAVSYIILFSSFHSQIYRHKVVYLHFLF